MGCRCVISEVIVVDGFFNWVWMCVLRCYMLVVVCNDGCVVVLMCLYIGVSVVMIVLIIWWCLLWFLVDVSSVLAVCVFLLGLV